VEAVMTAPLDHRHLETLMTIENLSCPASVSVGPPAAARRRASSPDRTCVDAIRAADHHRLHCVRLIGAVVAIACVLAATPVRADDGEHSSEAAPALVVRGPAVAEVLTAAYRAAGLDRDPSRGWNARARVAGLVPWITVRTGRDTSWKNTDTDVGHGMVVEVRATWRLDRLVFDGRELQVASVEAARRRERRRLASRVIRAYFAWRRAVERTAERPDCDPADPAADPAGRGCASRAALVDEAAAELDALTDGWFSDALAEPPALSRGFSGRPSRRSASENRTR
jgi:hypothetical protein